MGLCAIEVKVYSKQHQGGFIQLERQREVATVWRAQETLDHNRSSLAQSLTSPPDDQERMTPASRPCIAAVKTNAHALPHKTTKLALRTRRPR